MANESEIDAIFAARSSRSSAWVVAKSDRHSLKSALSEFTGGIRLKGAPFLVNTRIRLARFG